MPDRTIIDGPDGFEVHTWPSNPVGFDPSKTLAIVKRGDDEQGLYSVLARGMFNQDGAFVPVSKQALAWLTQVADEISEKDSKR